MHRRTGASALKQGFQVSVLTDACGDVSLEAHERAVQRMIQAGAVPMTSLQCLLELQRDWARAATYDKVLDVVKAYGGTYGQGVVYAKSMYGASEGKAGLPFGAGTDATRVASYDPWVCLAWLVTGTTVGGTRLYPEHNCLDRETALRLWTAGTTWFSNEQDKKGQIKRGQLADFALLSADYFEVPEREIRGIELQLTVLGGKVVHAAGPFSPLAPPLPPAMLDWSPQRGFSGSGHRAFARSTTACCVHPHALPPAAPTDDARGFGGRSAARVGRSDQVASVSSSGLWAVSRDRRPRLAGPKLGCDGGPAIICSFASVAVREAERCTKVGCVRTERPRSAPLPPSPAHPRCAP